MNRIDWKSVTGQFDEKYIQEALDTYGHAPAVTRSDKTEDHTMQFNHYSARRHTRRLVSIALAACLVLALCIVAYATDLFGLRAIQLQNDDLVAYRYEDNGDGTRTPVENPDGGFVSITQPQDVPAEMDSAIREKIENSTAAWAEWKEWCRTSGSVPTEPEVFLPPEDCYSSSYDENDDGTWTITFYGPWEPVYDEDENIIDWAGPVLETRIATAEEYAQEMAFHDAVSMGFPGYDWNYGVYTREMADKLEEIAARYGLRLRHQSNALFQNFGDQTDFLSREELTARINEICADGRSFFRTEPTGYDKFYYFDEGTFCVSFYTTDDFSNGGTSCYLYNSPYATLSSGYEVISEVQDVNALYPRTHTTPDGTEVTILHNGADMFAYVYLENSFVNMHLQQPDGLSDEEIDRIVDMIDFSAIA